MILLCKLFEDLKNIYAYKFREVPTNIAFFKIPNFTMKLL